MTGFNLPPGVNVSDIPGNRPEDEAEDAFWEALDTEFFSSETEDSRRISRLFKVITNEEAIRAYVVAAREIAYKAGYEQGTHDADLARYVEENHTSVED